MTPQKHTVQDNFNCCFYSKISHHPFWGTIFWHCIVWLCKHLWSIWAVVLACKQLTFSVYNEQRSWVGEQHVCACFANLKVDNLISGNEQCVARNFWRKVLLEVSFLNTKNLAPPHLAMIIYTLLFAPIVAHCSIMPML